MPKRVSSLHLPLAAERSGLLDRLDDELRLARRPTPEFFSKLAAGACTRLAALQGMGPAARIERLIAVGAWNDAALALIELETPSWKVRRIIREDGEWLCSLSRQPNLPLALDDTVEASHEILPLAILGALVEARRRSSVASDPLASVPQIQAGSGQVVCCDNYA